MDRINELRQAAFEAGAEVKSEEKGLTALLDEQGTARKDYRALLKKQTASAIPPTDEQKATFEAAETSVESFDARLSAQRKLVDQTREGKVEADEDVKVEEARLAAETAAIVAHPTAAAVVLAPAPNAADDPKKGFKDHRDFMRCVMRAGMGGQLDERLVPLIAPMAVQGSDEQQVASAPFGGFLVPVGVAPGILTVTPESDPLAAFIRQIPMMAPIVQFNARVDKNHATSVSGGLLVTRHPETVDGSSSRMQFEQITMTANEELGIAFATEKILTDSPESFVALLSAGFADEYVANAMLERLQGTGVGERQGVMNSPCLIEVAKEGSQLLDTIVTENIDKMASRCWRYSRAVWLANHDTRPQLRGLVRVVGTGGSIVPYFQNDPQGAELLDGRPIFFTEFAQTLGDLGDIVLGNWSEYLEGTYQTPRQDESIHVRFVALERAFRFYRRNDGQWWWRSALTPRNGATISPAVTLAERA